MFIVLFLYDSVRSKLSLKSYCRNYTFHFISFHWKGHLYKVVFCNYTLWQYMKRSSHRVARRKPDLRVWREQKLFTWNYFYFCVAFCLNTFIDAQTTEKLIKTCWNYTFILWKKKTKTVHKSLWQIVHLH